MVPSYGSMNFCDRPSSSTVIVAPDTASVSVTTRRRAPDQNYLVTFTGCLFSGPVGRPLADGFYHLVDVTIPRARHVSNQHNPEAFNVALVSFLDRVLAPADATDGGPVGVGGEPGARR